MLSDAIECPGGCNTIYCSEDCKDADGASGHGYLCTSIPVPGTVRQRAIGEFM